MSILNRLKKPEKRNSNIGIVIDSHGNLCVNGFVPLNKCPEIVAAVNRIAELISTMTIHLMSNEDDGDVRIINELSRTIDINPMPTMTRAVWMHAIINNLLLYGEGNSVVVPHTHAGYLESLEPIAASRVSFMPVGNSYREYKVLIDGVAKNPKNLCHFVWNPDKTYLWKGQGITVSLNDLAKSLKQADKTKNAFLSSEWKPSVIVRVDALTDEFASPEGREKLIENYINPAQEGSPWVIPADMIDVQQIKPLSLADLAINETVELDKKTVASLLGVPPYLLGVGTFDRDEWNSFIQSTIKAIVTILQQEMTKKLIISPKWYLRFNLWSLLDYDLKTVSDVLLAGSDRGFVCGDEWRERMNLSPAGLDEFRVLENYIPWDMSGLQAKLQGGDAE